MFSFCAWLRRLGIWTATITRPVRLRRGRRGGLWFLRGRGSRTARSPYRDSAMWPFEWLEPLVLLAADNWLGGASTSWTDAAN